TLGLTLSRGSFVLLAASLCFAAPSPSAFYTLSLHDALPICFCHWIEPVNPLSVTVVTLLLHTVESVAVGVPPTLGGLTVTVATRSEEHTSELQSLRHLVCRLLLEKKKRERRHT